MFTEPSNTLTAVKLYVNESILGACVAICVGPHLLFANAKGGTPTPPPPTESRGRVRPLGMDSGGQRLIILATVILA